jgi:hypothetical protein
MKAKKMIARLAPINKALNRTDLTTWLGTPLRRSILATAIKRPVVRLTSRAAKIPPVTVSLLMEAISEIIGSYY